MLYRPRIIHIDQTLIEVCRAIDSAETTMRHQIKTYYQNVNEEFITTLFYGHINYSLREASNRDLIANAFLEDLKRSIRQVDSVAERAFYGELRRHSAGLIADVILHNKQQEGKTGGDFGLIIVHPQIELSKTFLEIRKGVSSGILAQAKLKDKDGKWPGLTDNQRNELPKHFAFAALVLYSYANSDRTELNSVIWQPCREQILPEIERLLKNDSFQQGVSTTDIVTFMGRKQIGTQNQQLIETVVSPAVRQYFEIRIHWKGDDVPGGPSGHVRLKWPQQVRRQEQLLNRQGRT
jgi:hypothetical protein